MQGEAGPRDGKYSLLQPTPAELLKFGGQPDVRLSREREINKQDPVQMLATHDVSARIHGARGSSSRPNRTQNAVRTTPSTPFTLLCVRTRYDNVPRQREHSADTYIPTVGRVGREPNPVEYGTGFGGPFGAAVERNVLTCSEE